MLSVNSKTLDFNKFYEFYHIILDCMPLFLSHAKSKRKSLDQGKDKDIKNSNTMNVILNTEEKLKDYNSEPNNNITDGKTTEGNDYDDGICCICEDKKADTMLECLVIFIFIVL